jgi:hypothetical protein
MTPDELNAHVAKIAEKLGGQVITPADDAGTEPEIGIELEGAEFVLVVSPV